MEKELGIYRKKLQRYYEIGGKLTQYPQKRPMRILALLKIAERFASERQYTEKEVNEKIKESIAFNDVELIRRELYEYKFLDRQRDGSSYWVRENWREAYKEYLEE